MEEPSFDSLLQSAASAVRAAALGGDSPVFPALLATLEKIVSMLVAHRESRKREVQRALFHMEQALRLIDADVCAIPTPERRAAQRRLFEAAFAAGLKELVTWRIQEVTHHPYAGRVGNLHVTLSMLRQALTTAHQGPLAPPKASSSGSGPAPAG